VTLASIAVEELLLVLKIAFVVLLYQRVSFDSILPKIIGTDPVGKGEKFMREVCVRFGTPAKDTHIDFVIGKQEEITAEVSAVLMFGKR